MKKVRENMNITVNEDRTVIKEYDENSKSIVIIRSVKSLLTYV